MNEQTTYREPDDSLAALAELGRIRLGAQPLTQVLERVAQLARDVLMAQRRCTSDEAFEFLRNASP